MQFRQSRTVSPVFEGQRLRDLTSGVKMHSRPGILSWTSQTKRQITDLYCTQGHIKQYMQRNVHSYRLTFFFYFSSQIVPASTYFKSRWPQFTWEILGSDEDWATLTWFSICDFPSTTALFAVRLAGITERMTFLQYLYLSCLYFELVSCSCKKKSITWEKTGRQVVY